MRYIIRTKNLYYDCKNIDEVEKTVKALTFLGIKFDIYELTKVNK